MIIQHVLLHPFGGINNKEIQFKAGLNVVFGPNEAGKSTIFNAIKQVLFVSTQLPPGKLNTEMGRYFPRPAGDMAAVELEFQKNTDAYILKRSWGANPFSEFILPDGNTIGNEKEIAKRLAQLLPAEEGACRSVLLTYQSGLGRTLEDLKSTPETMHSFSEIVRKAVFESDGISVDAFMARLKERHDECFSRWDYDSNMPEGGRGINNPYKNSVGEILETFYEQETIRMACEKATAYETALDEVNSKISSHQQEICDCSQFLTTYKQAYGDVTRRIELESQLQILQPRLAAMKQAIAAWPVAESKMQDLAEGLPKLEARHSTLQAELTLAKQQEANSGLRKTFSAAQPLKNNLDLVQSQHDSIQTLTANDMQQLRAAAQEAERLKLAIEAGKLSARLCTRRAFALAVQKDAEPEVSKSLQVDETLTLEAGARISINHADWSLEIISGGGDSEKALVDYAKARENLEAEYERLKVSSVDQAEQLYAAYVESKQRVQQASAQLDGALGDMTFPELEQQIAALGPETPVRPSADVAQKFFELENAITTQKEKLREIDAQVEEYRKQYKDQDSLLDQLTNSRAKEKDLKTKGDALAPLPEEFIEGDDFKKAYDEMQSRHDAAANTKHAAELELKELEKNDPGQSSEELAHALVDAEGAFQKVLKKGEALRKILQKTEELNTSLSQGMYTGFEQDVTGYVSLMTDKRYSAVSFNDRLPNGLHTTATATLSHDLLSAGTKDVLALALRLALANNFLQGSDGFLILDDPLVDLDAERQQKAAQAIRDFAGKRQVIVFTCHKGHADMLGGNAIPLH